MIKKKENSKIINGEFEKNGSCSICDELYDSWGHNAEPISNGRCCEQCNATVVIPKRMGL